MAELQLSREALARQLCSNNGIAPDTLRPNTLDEEPDDGTLPCGAPGHFAWREMLAQADAAVRRTSTLN